MTGNFEVGDLVVTKSPFFHMGTDIGDRLGRVISTEGYILIEIANYINNPIKCFRFELDLLDKKKTENEVEDFLEKMEDIFIP